MEPLSGGKVDACVRNILDIRERTEAQRGAQLVFVDSSTPASGRWNIQDDVRRRLIEAGVPESEIACVTDAKGKSKQKEALYEKVRSGDVRILLGSTTTLGTGTNVQTRLVAIHDLDCPWRPSDLEQRLGRIVRQGNGFDHVHDFRYVSTGTFDSYLYSIVERKQRFISQVFTNKSPVRTMDDLDETVLSLAQMKQIAEGDPTVAERMDVENKIGQLKLMRESHLEGLADVQHKIETQYRPLVDALDAVADALTDLLDETPTRFELEQLAAASPLLKANTPGIPVFPGGIAPAANSYTLAGCCRAALVRGLSSPELYATALMAAETAISTARRFGGEVPEAIGTSEGLFSATIGIGGIDTAEIGVNCVDARSDGGVLIEGAAYPIADGGKERAFFGFVDTAEDSRDYMREVPDGADGFKRLADAALAASCATLSPNTADPCLVARLAAESRERSRSLTDPGTQARGAKRAAGSSARDGAAGRGPAL